MAGGQVWLAKELGVTQQRVSKLASSEDWTFGKGPWTDAQVPKIKAHVKARRTLNNATAGAYDEPQIDETDDAIKSLSKNPERVARIKLIIERTAKLKLERELLAGGYIRKEDADKESVARVYSVRAKLQEIPLRASLIAHKSETECEAIISDWMREVCDFYANGGN
jgi:hypothetical protein